MPKVETFTIEDAQIIYRNFAGHDMSMSISDCIANDVLTWFWC